MTLCRSHENKDLSWIFSSLLNRSESSESSRMSSSAASQPELEWIQMKKDFDAERIDGVETAREKFMRKFKQNPLVPIGELTLAAASYQRPLSERET